MPGDFERFQKIARDWERIRPSPQQIEQLQQVAREWEKIRPSSQQMEQLHKVARNWEKTRPSPQQIEQLQEIARNWEKMRPSPEQMESIRRQAELARELVSDPKVLRAHADAGRIFAQRNRALAQMPDAATQKALLEAARYFNSGEFQARRDAILQATQMARQRLGPEGLAAAELIAVRRTADDGSQERAAERIRAGEGTTLLEEASDLAASPEVREAIERADPEALVQLAEEQQSEAPAHESEVTAEPEVYEDEYPEITKEDLLEMHQQALVLLWSLEAAFAVLALTPTPASPIFTSLSLGVGGLIAFVHWSEAMISRWED